MSDDLIQPYNPDDVIMARPRSMEMAAAGDFAPLGPTKPSWQHGGSPSIATLLLRRKWLMLAAAAVVWAVGIPLVWLLYKPLYRATSVLRISPVAPTIVFNLRNNEVPQYQLYVNTEVSVVCSPTIRERVMDRTDFKETQWYKDTDREVDHRPN